MDIEILERLENDGVSLNASIGGLVGEITAGSTLTDCYSTGNVSPANKDGSYNEQSLHVGGLTGESTGDNSAITHCFATGIVTSPRNNFTGGLVGSLYISEITSSYYNGTNTSGIGGDETSENVFPIPDNFQEVLTDSESGWDFTSTWYFPDGKDYPVLLAHPSTLGDGTEDDPYLILTAADLAVLKNYLGKDYQGTYFALGKDIDLTDYLSEGGAGYNEGKGWEPVGKWDLVDVNFYGHVDGGGHTVSGLWINRPETDDIGLFGRINGKGSVSNLTVEIDEKGIKGADLVGGLVGYSLAPIVNCHVSGEGTVSGADWVGGLVGHSENDISYCSSTVAVDGENYCGGLIGNQVGEKTVLQSYSAGTVTATKTQCIAGGLIGYNSGDITQCYATGDVDGFESEYSFTGGLVGAVIGKKNAITQSYATGTLTGHVDYTGGLTGGIAVSSILTLENCFYREGMFSGDPIYKWIGRGAKAEGESTAYLRAGEDMKTTSTFTSKGWDFNTLWNIDPAGTINDGYPYLDPREYVPPVGNEYHTVTLILGGSITCNYAAGQLTVAEGEHLYLQFQADGPAVAAADILFLVDDAEVSVNDQGKGSFTYILNPITEGHTIVIALREYPVTIPEVDGATTNPAPGEHLAPYGEPFRFTLTLKDLNDLETLKVFVNNTELSPVETGYALSASPIGRENIRANTLDRSDPQTGHALSLQYVIPAVTGPINITIEGINPTGNAAIAGGKVSVAVENGELKVESGHPVDVAVYSITGKSVVSLRALSGSGSIKLPGGIYVVKAGQTAAKVIIP